MSLLIDRSLARRSAGCVLALMTLCLVTAALSHSPILRADTEQPKGANGSRAALVESLEPFNGLVGGWRGVGQPKRNSAKDSWSETASWVWDIKADRVALNYAVTKGRLMTSGTLTYDPAEKLYQFDAVLPDKSPRKYSGKLEGTKLTLESPKDAAGQIHQVVITQLNEKRTLVLFQSRLAEQSQFQRVAEVGYTREGTTLAVEGAGDPECIVTGGKGTSSTVYKGKTYYFCCTGCRDAFNDDPDGIIAEAERKAAKKKGK